MMCSHFVAKHLFHEILSQTKHTFTCYIQQDCDLLTTKQNPANVGRLHKFFTFVSIFGAHFVAW